MAIAFRFPISMPEAFSSRVRAFGCIIDIVSEGHEARDFLGRYVFPLMPREEPGPATAHITLRVIESREGIHLFSNDVALGSSREPKELATKLINAIDVTVIQTMKDLYAIHAGAVLIDGHGLLLPGRTHAGKSSLVAELLRRGARYFSDEYALIDSAGRVHAYPRPLLIRNGGPRQSPVLPEECNSSVVDAPAPVRWILSLAFERGASWSVKEIPQSTALFGLLQNTPHALENAPGMVPSFERAVADAVCLAGRRGEAAEAAERILHLVDSSR
jgi:hypothetical protein